jgi:enamine deaminase RidA (YjgF/YER057c/UK114 family)
VTVQLTKPLAQYSHFRKVNDLIFIAGQGCRDPETNQYAGIFREELTGKVKSYDIKAQTEGVLKNIERVLQSLSLNRSHLVDIQVFLKTMDDFPKMNEVWNSFFKEVAQPPTRTTVAVLDLPGDNFIEMKSIAALRQI